MPWLLPIPCHSSHLTDRVAIPTTGHRALLSELPRSVHKWAAELGLAAWPRCPPRSHLRAHRSPASTKRTCERQCRLEPSLPGAMVTVLHCCWTGRWGGGGWGGVAWCFLCPTDSQVTGAPSASTAPQLPEPHRRL